MEIRRGHLLGFLAIHFLSILTLTFWTGFTYNRIANIEERTHETAAIVAFIQENGTSSTRIQLGYIKEQLTRLEVSVAEVQKNTR